MCLKATLLCVNHCKFNLRVWRCCKSPQLKVLAPNPARQILQFDLNQMLKNGIPHAFTKRNKFIYEFITFTKTQISNKNLHFCQFKWSKSSVLVASPLFLRNSFQNSCNSKETLKTYVIWTDFVIWIDFVICFWYGFRSSWDIPWYLQSFWQSMTWWTKF